MIGTFHGVIEKLMGLPFPVVAAVNGAALGGGCELALACDVVIAREGAKLGQPEICLGVFPPAAAVLLPRLVGPQVAADLILSGRVIEAGEASKIGLVSQVIPADEFDSAVGEYLESLASLSGPVLRIAKRALRDGELGTPTDAMRRVERIYLDELMQIDDAHEGLAAFTEKRAPVWTGG
jgi:cyclohexa-1,5-dienecarbonyl-CoA hydratase